MGNKVKFNLKNVHAAKLTEKEEGGSTKFEYGVPKAIPGACQYQFGRRRRIQSVLCRWNRIFPFRDKQWL